MKFMVMHKSSAQSEAEEMPSQELIANVGALVQGAIQSGTLIDAAGLRASSRRARITFASGERFVETGPFTGKNELLAGFATLTVKNMPEAIEWATRLGKAAGNVDVEVGPITEAWDLGMVPKPEGEVPLRVLALLKADAAAESGAAPTAALQKVLAAATKASVLVSAQTLLPSAKGTRIKGAVGARSVVDGPFAESKELVAGFMLLEFPSKLDAVTWAVRYADVVGTPEVDVREVP
jgi:hypothetical protein